MQNLRSTSIWLKLVRLTVSFCTWVACSSFYSSTREANEMSRRTQQFPEALVLQWNSQTLRVLCPYCLYSHGHGFSQPQKEDNIDKAQPGWKLRMAGKRRRSDCQDSETAGEYLFVFPQKSNSHGSGYGWEVDRESCKFITVNH